MHPRRNILLLTSSFMVGGAETLVLGLAERLDRSQLNVHVAALSVVRGNRLQPAFERLDLPVTVFKRQRFYDPRLIQTVLRYVRQHRIDLIHTHLLDADIVGTLVGRVLRRPVVCTLHNMPVDYDKQQLHRRQLERLAAGRLATRLIAVSQGVRDAFMWQWQIVASRIDTIYNGIPVERYLPIPAGVPPTGDQPGALITTIGRLAPVKAQHTLLDAAKLVVQQRPDARFMLVGEGPREHDLRQHAAALGITDRVIFAGVRHDIPAVLAQSDLFVLPSLWEGLPMTVIEAMAAARPVVLTDVGGNRELVQSDAQGLIVPPNDGPALAAALLALLNDPERRVALGLAARERVRHTFSLDACARQHELLYAGL